MTAQKKPQRYIEWQPVPEAIEYRCTIRSANGHQLDEPIVLPPSRCALETTAPDDAQLYVDLTAIMPCGRHVQVTPPGRLLPRRKEDPAELAWPDCADVYRLVVHDLTSFTTAFDDVIWGNRFPLNLTGANTTHDLKYSVSAWTETGWKVIRSAQTPPYAAFLGTPKPASPPLDPAALPALLMLFTVDTEAGIHRMRYPDPARAVDELIFGNFGGREQLGIGLHMDLLEHFGHRGCFFVDILLELQFGRAALETILETIIARGHEVQLHVHTQHLLWHTDPRWQARYRALEDYDADGMRHVMDLAVSLFEQRMGKPPLAYRAGGFHIDDESLRLITERGLRFDSSIVPYYRANTSNWTRSRTQPFAIGNIVEFPPSWFLRCDQGTKTDTRIYAPNPTAGDPLTHMLGATPTPHVATFTSHSFQMLRYTPVTEPGFRDRWIRTLQTHANDIDTYRPLIPSDSHSWKVHEPEIDNAMVATVTQLLRRVAERGDARCTTFEELDTVADDLWRQPRSSPTDPVLALDTRRGAYHRMASQIYDGAFLSRLEDSGTVSRVDAAGTEVAALKHADVFWRDARVAIQGPISQSARDWILQHDPRDVLDGDWLRSERSAHIDVAVWLQSPDRQSSATRAKQLAKIREHLRPGGRIVLLVWSLGVGPQPPPPLTFPLAELLFAEPVLATHGVVDAEFVTALDTTSWIHSLQAAGFAVTTHVAAHRPRDQVALLAEHQSKVRFLDPSELNVAALAVCLTDRQDGAQDVATAGPPRVSNAPDHALVTARQHFSHAPPGTESRIALSTLGDALSQTSALLSWMRAGFEVSDLVERSDGFHATLVRPLTIADIDRFGGRE